MPAIYVHIPFCLKKCDYCDFFSVPTERSAVPHEAYLAAIVKQLESDAPLFEGGSAPSVYFGGGTPSIMPPEFFARLLSELRGHFNIDFDAEISCEVNPATADADWFKAARAAGITRISIGVQSFQDRLLTMLGRIHSADDAMRAIAEAQESGFESVSIDLMYAIPGEGMSDLEEDMRIAMTFQPEHISAYQLTIEEGTPFAAWFAGDVIARSVSGCERPKAAWQTRRLPRRPAELDSSQQAPQSQADNGLQGIASLSLAMTASEDVQLKRMRTVTRMLGRGGWKRYEISNYAKPGFECRHNLNYWQYGEYLGLGAGATSFILSGAQERRRAGAGFAQRWTQVRDIASYIKGTGALAESEEISLKTAMGEFCFMNLRTVEGISRLAFEERFGVPFGDVYSGVVSECMKNGLLAAEGNRVFLSPRGFELANQVFEKFV